MAREGVAVRGRVCVHADAYRLVGYRACAAIRVVTQCRGLAEADVVHQVALIRGERIDAFEGEPRHGHAFGAGPVALVGLPVLRCAFIGIQICELVVGGDVGSHSPQLVATTVRLRTLRLLRLFLSWGADEHLHGVRALSALMLQAPVVGVARRHTDVLIDGRSDLGGDDFGPDVVEMREIPPLDFDGPGLLLAARIIAIRLRAVPAESGFIPAGRTGLPSTLAVGKVLAGGWHHRGPVLRGNDFPKPAVVGEVPVDDMVGQLRGVGRRIVRRCERRDERGQQACQHGQHGRRLFHES